MWFYRILFAFDVLVVLVLAYFFIDGLQYNPSGATLALWLPILAMPIGVLTGAWVVAARGKKRLASVLLTALAIPPLIFVLFFGALLVANPSWH
jgi:hypothetical protein